MPFEIVRNDITTMKADAIVNAANPRVAIGYGVDTGIHKKAGPKLIEARKEIGSMCVGQVVVTPAFELDAKYVIHAVGPVWQGGCHNEEALLGQCYRGALALAKEHNCDSIAFPLLSSGNYGFLKPLALQVAIREISSFLMEHDMQIYLVVFSRDAFVLSEKLFQSVASYIDETYIRDKTLEEYGFSDKQSIREAELMRIQEEIERHEFDRREFERRERTRERIEQLKTNATCFMSYSSASSLPSTPQDLDSALEDIDAGFSETLLRYIDRAGKKDSDIYKRANIDRKLFSKIRNNADYRPSKATALAFAIALELDLDETRDFIARAGYALSHSSKFDIIVEYFILHNNYDVFELNEVLFAFDQPLIGA